MEVSLNIFRHDRLRLRITRQANGMNARLRHAILGHCHRTSPHECIVHHLRLDQHQRTFMLLKNWQNYGVDSVSDHAWRGAHRIDVGRKPMSHATILYHAVSQVLLAYVE